VKKRALNQNNNTNTIAHKNAGNRTYSRTFGPSKFGALGLRPFEPKAVVLNRGVHEPLGGTKH